MKTIYALAIAAIIGITIPCASMAASFPRQVTVTGTVTKLYDNQITILTSSAAQYTAETSQSQLIRKFGQAMLFKDIFVGDKMEIKGILYNDNSMNANIVRNMSLYTHSGTFTAKISTVNPQDQTITIWSKSYGEQTIHTDQTTVFKENSSNSTYTKLEPGMNVTVKGTWDRSTRDVIAKEIKSTIRMVNIDITGTLMMKGANNITVVGENNVMYGVDITSARLLSKNSKAIKIEDLTMSGTMRVKGKHRQESNQVIASQIKDMSLVKN